MSLDPSPRTSAGGGMAAPLAAASKRDQKANGGAVDCICLAVDNDHGRIVKPLREFFRRDTMNVRSHTRGRGRRRQLSLITFAAFAGAMLASWPIPARAADPNEFIVWSDPNLRGRMYVPSNYTPGGDHPLILFLHGFGERGTDNIAQVDSNIDPLLEAAKQRGAFLYAPQSSGGAWGTTAAGPTLDVQRAVNMMHAAQAAYPGIDDDRLYLTGLSAGGGGAWDALASYPRTFAAGAPICGTLGSSVYRESLEDENIWAVHARNDSVVSVANSRNMINAIFTGDGFPAATFPPLGRSG